MMDASSSENEALCAADDEIEILKRSLGNDFVLEDTVVFEEPVSADNKGGEPLGAGSDETASDGLTIALVSSDKYDTAELIEKLGKNRNIAKAEPNYIYRSNAFDDYSLNDEYSSYLYHVNSPAAKNTDGDSVDDRGTDPEKALLVNASSGWKKVADTDNEVVVAVIDGGVLDTHEDLKEMMWTNPGDISDIFDSVIDLLGEDGVISCIAAGNDGENNDDLHKVPSNTDSEYAISVGSADISGKPSAFSDYGKTELTDRQKKLADVNGDGIADVLDAFEIQKIAVEKNKTA